MKLLQLYNQYRSMHGGEEAVVRNTARLVEEHGGVAKLIMPTSRGIERSIQAKVHAFFSGIYSRSSYREVLSELQRDPPDVVHAHNLYPLLSPSVLVACRHANIPVVLSTHNYVLTCPTTHHLYNGEVCQACSGGKEYHCVLKNCRGNLLESVAYASRSWFARRFGLYRDNVTLFIVLSQFARSRLIDVGFPADRIEVLPNMVELVEERPGFADGHYVAFSGRMSKEKGIDTLLEAASKLPDVPFHLAGDGPLLDAHRTASPNNAKFEGRLEGMDPFYRNARFLVIPSRWFEGCPLVVSEAMTYGLPVIASRIGSLPELVDDGETGFLFEPGDSRQLARKIDLLWNDRQLCHRMGQAGRRKAECEYSEATYFSRLDSIYRRAIRMSSRRPVLHGEPAVACSF